MSSDTGGLFFPRRSPYLCRIVCEQVCLAALFILARNEKGKPSALAEGAFMIVLIIFTVSSVYDDHDHERQLKATV